NHPYGERSVPMLGVAPPRRPIVHGHPLGKSIPPELVRQVMLDRFGSLIRTRFQTYCKSGMIIQYGQWVAFHIAPYPKPAFEIHLPKLIGLGMLKPFPGLVF